MSNTGSILNYEFKEPEILWLLLLVPLLIAWYFFSKRGDTKSLTMPGVTFKGLGKQSFFPILMDSLYILQFLGIGFLVLALARPQNPDLSKEYEDTFSEGIDIMIAMDISGSMLARDFDPDRLGASIEVAKSFIGKRKNDRIGLTVYGGEAILVSPVTLDHASVKEKLDELSTDMVTPRTAIGDGLTTAGAGLYKSEAKSKIIILLTDGVNNWGSDDPIDAAQSAKAFGIKVYTIGVGKEGEAPFPTNMGGIEIIQNLPVEIDEELMKQISNETGGKYYRAENNKELLNIYGEIDKLEKSKIKSAKVVIEPPEEFRWYAIPGILLLLVPFLLRTTILRTIP